MKREETNDIVQNVYDLLKEVGIDKKFCKQDVTTQKSLLQRGDLWISLSKNDQKDFEKNIVSLIEAKHKKCVIGDAEWQDAMTHGKKKALKQGLNYYIVTNCKDSVRFYNAHTDEEITMDGTLVTKLQPIKRLVMAQTQINANNSNIITTIPQKGITTEKDFQKSLNRLKEIFRACAIKDSNKKINTTISFIILKYINEMEAQERSLDDVVQLWNDYGPNYKSDILGSVKDILSGEYGNKYVDFKGIIDFSSRLSNQDYAKIHAEFDKYHFHGCGFDIYGAIYEEFASKKEKKEFGEFYTRRHITKFVSRLLLRNENKPRPITICDPACGTGGFLTEAYKALLENYRKSGTLNEGVRKALQSSVFYGYDNQPDSIQRTILNMFLVGDGHTNIKESDSLANLETDKFDYVVANPPYGPYEGNVPMSNFTFTNQRRFELLFIEKIVNATKFGQEMAIVMPDGVLETPTNEEFRKKLLMHCNIHAIVSLTRFAFAPYTKEKTYVLFMQKKQKDDIGKMQEEPIWHFILDHDGFANSDKRFLTPSLNDISLLEKVFLKGNKSKKYGFVPMNKVNKKNFHNLLSEFHLRPIKVQKKTVSQFNDLFDELLGELNGLINKAKKVKQSIKKNHTISAVDIVEKNVYLNKVIENLPKNSGLTEQFIYLNENPNKKQIPIYTSSPEILGYLPEGTKKNGKPLIVHKGESIIVFRKGKAGTMIYTDGNQYIPSENSIPFQITKEYKGKVILKWFYYTYRRIFLNWVTSKADNATFNLDVLGRLKIDIPKPDIQKRIVEKYKMLEDLEEDVRKVNNKLKEIEFTSIKQG